MGYLKYAKNIYLIVLTLFVIWMLFFDTNSFQIHQELSKEIDQLQYEKAQLEKEISKDQDLLKALEDPKELERYARERYGMQKENEEVFVIEHLDSIKKQNEEP